VNQYLKKKLCFAFVFISLNTSLLFQTGEGVLYVFFQFISLETFRRPPSGCLSRGSVDLLSCSHTGSGVFLGSGVDYRTFRRIWISTTNNSLVNASTQGRLYRRGIPLKKFGGPLAWPLFLMRWNTALVNTKSNCYLQWLSTGLLNHYYTGQGWARDVKARDWDETETLTSRDETETRR